MTTTPSALKRLPISIQHFDELREDDYLYVDKTADILRLVNTGKFIFLSRPRRFGKSLLVTTLEQLFKGNKPLFQGLYIYDKWDWDKKYPVIPIDWSGFIYDSLEILKMKLGEHFLRVAKAYGVTISELRADSRLDDLIREIHTKTGQKVVLLIDEYDKLMLDAIEDSDKFGQMRDFLHSIYGILKHMGNHLHFVFLTGVSRFAGLSIFSGLNNLCDITLEPEFSTLCGYTQRELEENFSGDFDVVAKQLAYTKNQLLAEIKKWYNGYSWDGENFVYNPFSILHFTRKKEFDNFWCQTGTPTFLVKAVQMRNDVSKVIRALRTSALQGDGVSKASDIPFEQLLFQTGYLTIKKIERLSGTSKEYVLDFPNSEVQESFLGVLLTAYFATQKSVQDDLTKKLTQQLQAADAAGIEESLRTMLSWVPYTIIRGEREGYYHALMLLWLRVLGFEIQGEVTTNRGIIDAVWTLPHQKIVIEVKFDESVSKKEKLLDEALAQIKENGYAEGYMNFAGKVSLLGVAFAGKEVACRLEILKEK